MEFENSLPFLGLTTM